MDSHNSGNKPEKNIDSSTNGLDSLPREVALDILSRLPITSLMQCRFVSRSLQNLTHDQNLINLHLSRTAKNSICLLVHCSFPYGHQFQFVEFSDHNNREIVKKIQTPFPNLTSQPELNVVGSCNGLTCLSYSKDHDVLQICNPLTRSYKVLPSSSRQFEDQKVLVGFGFHPITNEYKVVRIVYYPVRIRLPECKQSEVQVHTVGNNDWRSIGKIPYRTERWSSKPLLVKGRLHWLSQYGYAGDYAERIFSFDLADEQFREVQTPSWGGKRINHYPIAVLGGCLSMILYPYNKNLEIWVMKEYGVKESWRKDFQIDVNGLHSRGTGMWSKRIQTLACQVLCLTKKGKILLMQGGSLASYDPERRVLKNVKFGTMPDSLQVVLHEGSLVCIENT